MGNMYGDSVAQLPWFQGCGKLNEKGDLEGHNCRYCGFRLQAYRQKWNCEDCYNFVTHLHQERFKRYPGKPTTGDEFNWIGASGEPAFLSCEDIDLILAQAAKRPDRRYFLQTKDPRWWVEHEFPANVWLGITLETNVNEGYEAHSDAPFPTARFQWALAWFDANQLKRFHSVTIEPIMRFTDDLIWMVETLNPEVVYVGYNSKPKHHALPEPPLADVISLMKRLQDWGIKVKPKLLREAIL